MPMTISYKCKCGYETPEMMEGYVCEECKVVLADISFRYPGGYSQLQEDEKTDNMLCPKCHKRGVLKRWKELICPKCGSPMDFYGVGSCF